MKQFQCLFHSWELFYCFQAFFMKCFTGFIFSQYSLFLLGLWTTPLCRFEKFLKCSSTFSSYACSGKSSTSKLLRVTDKRLCYLLKWLFFRSKSQENFSDPNLSATFLRALRFSAKVKAHSLSSDSFSILIALFFQRSTAPSIFKSLSFKSFALLTSSKICALVAPGFFLFSKKLVGVFGYLVAASIPVALFLCFQCKRLILRKHSAEPLLNLSSAEYTRIGVRWIKIDYNCVSLSVSTKVKKRRF